MPPGAAAGTLQKLNSSRRAPVFSKGDRRAWQEAILGIPQTLRKSRRAGVNHVRPADTDISIIDVKIPGVLEENVEVELLSKIIDTYLSEVTVRIEVLTAAADCSNCELHGADQTKA